MATPMTPTTEGKQLAIKWANAEPGTGIEAQISDFDGPGALHLKALARLATEHLALKAEHEKALADLREIDGIAVKNDWASMAAYRSANQAAAIAAKWRVETDPLVEALRALDAKDAGPITEQAYADELRAELSKRGYEIGGKS